MAGTGQYYVYELIDPRDGKPFYVGKGHGLRFKQHERFAKRGDKAPRYQRIREIWADGHKVAHRIVRRFRRDRDAYAFEVQHIASIGLHLLTNRSPGGEGLRAMGGPWGDFSAQRRVERMGEIPVHLMDLGVGLPA
jgi:hypothetical protein